MATIGLPDLDMTDFNLIIADKEVGIRRRDKLIAQLTEEIAARDEALEAVGDIQAKLDALEKQLASSLLPIQEPVTPGPTAPEKEENDTAAPTPTP